MLSFKNWVALGVFLFGSTFLWMTRDFLANPREGSGALWTVIQVLVMVTILGLRGRFLGPVKKRGGDVAFGDAVAGSATVRLAALRAVRDRNSAATPRGTRAFR